MAFYDTGDGRNLFLPDDLTEEERQERIASYIFNYPLPTVEEETVETTPTTVEEEPPQNLIPNPYDAIAPKLRPEESYSEGDPALFSTDLSLEENLSGKNQILKLKVWII